MREPLFSPQERFALFALVAFAAIILALSLLIALAFWLDSALLVRQFVGDPIYRALLKTIVLVNGDMLWAIVLVTAVYWFVIKLLQSVGSVSARVMQRHRFVFADDEVSLQNAQETLERLSSQDLEYAPGPHLSELPGGESLRRAQTTLYRGCLLGLFWIILAVPVSVLLGWGFYDAWLRLLGAEDMPKALLASPADSLPEIGPLLPLETSVWGLPLGQRSLALVLILGALSLINWIVRNISASGWTFPWGPGMRPFGLPKRLWWMVAASLVLAYVLVNTALLLSAITFVVLDLLAIAAYRLFVRRLQLVCSQWYASG
jgi:hypothetical protein